jgi:hypothetical protein
MVIDINVIKATVTIIIAIFLFYVLPIRPIDKDKKRE